MAPRLTQAKKAARALAFERLVETEKARGLKQGDAIIAVRRRDPKKWGSNRSCERLLSEAAEIADACSLRAEIKAFLTFIYARRMPLNQAELMPLSLAEHEEGRRLREAEGGETIWRKIANKLEKDRQRDIDPNAEEQRMQHEHRELVRQVDEVRRLLKKLFS